MLGQFDRLHWAVMAQPQQVIDTGGWAYWTGYRMVVAQPQQVIDTGGWAHWTGYRMVVAQP